MSRPKVLLADDHALILDGLKALLEPDFDVVETVQDGRALVEAARRLRPDVIIVDIAMPLMNGLQAAHQIKKIGLKAKVIFLTMHLDVDLATQAVRLGASAYILKSSAPHELRAAIDEALGGGVYITPLIGSDVLRAITKNVPEAAGRHLLTERQSEVLQLLAEGHTSKKIASLLSVSKTTVEFHKARLKQILNVNTIAELTQYAVRSNILVSPSHPEETGIKGNNVS